MVKAEYDTHCSPHCYAFFLSLQSINGMHFSQKMLKYFISHSYRVSNKYHYEGRKYCKGSILRPILMIYFLHKIYCIPKAKTTFLKQKKSPLKWKIAGI